MVTAYHIKTDSDDNDDLLKQYLPGPVANIIKSIPGASAFIHGLSSITVGIGDAISDFALGFLHPEQKAAKKAFVDNIDSSTAKTALNSLCTDLKLDTQFSDTIKTTVQKGIKSAFSYSGLPDDHSELLDKIITMQNNLTGQFTQAIGQQYQNDPTMTYDKAQAIASAAAASITGLKPDQLEKLKGYDPSGKNAPTDQQTFDRDKIAAQIAANPSSYSGVTGMLFGAQKAVADKTAIPNPEFKLEESERTAAKAVLKAGPPPPPAPNPVVLPPGPTPPGAVRPPQLVPTTVRH